MDKVELINSAIENCRVVSLDYAKMQRLLEPYYLAETEKGHLVLLGYQVGGESLFNENGWREFKIDFIENMQETEMFFIERNSESLLMMCDVREIIVGGGYRSYPSSPWQ